MGNMDVSRAHCQDCTAFGFQLGCCKLERHLRKARKHDSRLSRQPGRQGRRVRACGGACTPRPMQPPNACTCANTEPQACALMHCVTRASLVAPNVGGDRACTGIDLVAKVPKLPVMTTEPLRLQPRCLVAVLQYLSFDSLSSERLRYSPSRWRCASAMVIACKR